MIKALAIVTLVIIVVVALTIFILEWQDRKIRQMSFPRKSFKIEIPLTTCKLYYLCEFIGPDKKLHQYQETILSKELHQDEVEQ